MTVTVTVARPCAEIGFYYEVRATHERITQGGDEYFSHVVKRLWSKLVRFRPYGDLWFNSREQVVNKYPVTVTVTRNQ